jgi:hypothetical protein
MTVNCHKVRKMFNRLVSTYFKILYLKSSIFWDKTPCSPLKVNRRFGGIYRLHLEDRRISQVRNNCESRWQAERAYSVLLPALTVVSCSDYSNLKMEGICSCETSLTFNGLYGVISQKMVLFITAAVRTSNPTYLSFLGGTEEKCKTVTLF